MMPNKYGGTATALGAALDALGEAKGAPRYE